MPFLMEFDGKGGIKVTDLDSHKETPCGLCISSAFRLGYFLHDPCGDAIAKMTKEEREKIIKMLDERDKKRKMEGNK